MQCTNHVPAMHDDHLLRHGGNCIKAFNELRKLTEAPIMIAPNWEFPFELICDACDIAVGAVLGQRKE